VLHPIIVNTTGPPPRSAIRGKDLSS
jgi:hypothetical protein